MSIDGGLASATRLGPSGLEKVEVEGPCVFTFDKGDSELRRPNVRGIMMAKKKPIDSLSPAELGVSDSNSMIIIKGHSSPPEKQPGQKFVGSESVPEVVDKLREEANVI